MLKLFEDILTLWLTSGMTVLSFPHHPLCATLEEGPCDKRRAMGLGQETVLLFLNVGRRGLGRTRACLRTISAKMQPRLQMSTAVE